jgi:hypothetical protein
MLSSARSEIAHNAAIFKRSALSSLVGFDEEMRFGAETELHLRAALSVELGNVQRVLSEHLVPPKVRESPAKTAIDNDTQPVSMDRVRRAFIEQANDQHPLPYRSMSLTGRPISSAGFKGVAWIRPGRGTTTLTEGWEGKIPEYGKDRDVSPVSGSST